MYPLSPLPYEHDALLLCLATRGESGLRNLVIGSTAMTVLSRSTRPVVLVPAEDN